MKKNLINLIGFSPKTYKQFDSKTNGAFGYTDLSNCIVPKDTKYGISDNYKLWHVVITVCAVVAVCLLLLGRSFSLQILGKERYLSMALANKTRIAQIQPERGVVFDKDDEVLVRNKPAFSLEMNTLACRQTITGNKNCTELITELNSIVNKSPKDAIEQLESHKTIVTVSKGLTKDEILPIESRLFEFPNLIISVQPERDYLYSDVFSHVLGYVGLDPKLIQPSYIGKSGVEDFYEEYLKGVSGRQIIQVDSNGKTYRVVAQQNAFPGKNVYTNLDLELQKKAYELLKTVIDSKKATGGAVIAQDPNTAGILALVSYPAYDPNKMSYGLTQKELDEILAQGAYPFFNRAISANYAPGSTFKLVVAAGALQEKVVTKYTSIFDPGYISVGSYIFRNWKTDGHGEVNLLRALQVSNDTYFYTIGGGYGGIKGLGVEKLSFWARTFGYGNVTGIDIAGETQGYIPDGVSRQWYLGDTYITSIGQGDVLATPLQVNNVTAYFANGGYLLKPKIVKSVDSVGEASEEIIAKDLISGENYDLVREGMKRVASPGGTAYPLFDFPIRHDGIQLAAKTGTSEYTTSEGEEKTHAWLTAFGPYEKSEIALTVFLEGGGAGSDDASPIAKELMDVWFAGR